MRWVLFLLLSFLPASAFADVVSCQALVNGNEELYYFDDEGELSTELTRREGALASPGAAWDWAWGEAPQCNSQVLIGYLGLTLSSEEIEGYCLSWADDDSWVLVPGERNFRGRCKRTTCEIVNATTDEVLAATSAMASAVAGGNAVASAAGVTVVSHSSGAWIMTGPAGYVASTLGTGLTTLTGILTAPATGIAAGVSVVAVGTAVYVCSE